MGGFDTIVLVDKAFGNDDIATLNAKLHDSKAYNIFQTGVSATAVFTGGMLTFKIIDFKILRFKLFISF